MNSRRPRLLLCMTPGIGLARWQSVGSLERELKPYVEYVERGWSVTIATYDTPEALAAVALPAGIDAVRCPPARLLPLAPWRMRKAFRGADVVKTNQSGGSWWYVAAARWHRRPILLRCGWLPGSYLETRDGLTLRLRKHRVLEGWAFRHANACLVATGADRQWAMRHYRVPGDRIHLRPNFVDTVLFQPAPDLGGAGVRPRSVVFVGRLDGVKNPQLLVEACALARVSELCLVGEGPERARLEALARERGVRLRLTGAVPQAELPKVLREHEVFALPSRVEGHPKALFEAMACGLPCVGTRVPGIETALRDGETGLLCETDVPALGAALGRLLDDAALRRRLGAAARRQVVETLSFATVMDSELGHARALLPGAGRDGGRGRSRGEMTEPQPISQAA
jgi:glycosyltransferase involved in cell wall biosynthesis